jgi:uncharacterized membrane protein YhaH (DUF805 family)
MDFSQAIASGFQNYVNFSGRSPRSAYWYWTLFAVIVGIVTAIIDNVIGVGITNTIASLALFLPGLAVSVRRLHDIDRTGWWVLIALTIIGIFLLIYWYCQPGTPGDNRYGPNPLKY